MKKILLIILLLNFSIILNSQVGRATITAKSGLRMRDEPSLKGNKIGLIPFKEEVIVYDILDEKVEINGVISSWYYVDWNGKEGWVFGGYLDFVADEESLKIMMTEILSNFPKEWLEFTFRNGQIVIYQYCTRGTPTIILDFNDSYPELIFYRGGHESKVYQITSIEVLDEIVRKGKISEAEYVFTLVPKYSDENIDVIFFTEDSFKTGKWTNFTSDTIYTVNSEFMHDYEVIQEDYEGDYGENQ